jgi:hypothetical protein
MHASGFGRTALADETVRKPRVVVDPERARETPVRDLKGSPSILSPGRANRRG